MPSGPRYDRLPLDEENLTFVPSSNYFSGIPTTAPPSFRSLPHRNDENAATIMPRSERPSASNEQEIDDSGVSLWGATESVAAGPSRDEVSVRLLEAVERLERRLGDKEINKEGADLESSDSRDQWRPNDILGTIGAILFAIIFLVWLGAIIIIPAVAKYKYASAVVAAAAAGASTSGLEVGGG